jgi:excisionase family DNA binding protein
MTRLTDAEVLLTPSEVASLFRVDPKTVTRWAKAGKLTSIRTLGGHRRYRDQNRLTHALVTVKSSVKHQGQVSIWRGSKDSCTLTLSWR